MMYQPPGAYEPVICQADANNNFFAQNYEASLRIANRILHSIEDSEDAVQTAFCAALRSFHTFRPDSSFNAWITHIVVKCCRKLLRDRRAKPQVPLDEVEHTIASPDPGPEALCYIRELERAHSKQATRPPSGPPTVLVSRIGTDQVGTTTTAARPGIVWYAPDGQNAFPSKARRRTA